MSDSIRVLQKVIVVAFLATIALTLPAWFDARPFPTAPVFEATPLPCEASLALLALLVGSLVMIFFRPHRSAPAVVMAGAGFLSGMISPSRDMLVRAASPPGAFGRVFGIVTTGFNIGGIFGPLLGGWIMDNNMPRWVFYASVIFMVLTAIMGLTSDWRSRRRSAMAAAE